MAISQPPFQSTLVDADDRVQTPWAQWFSQLQPVLQAVVASGPTSGRPTQNLFIGYPYFDTTIDQMVYWNGAIWVTYAPSTTGTSILKGNGTGGFNNAIAGIDFAPATSGVAILYGNGAGGFSSVAIGSGVTFISGVLSATGLGGTVTSVSGTGSVNGITLTGTVTSSGSLTLGGTLGGIGNSQLTNSSITINGSTVSLGGSTTVTATATNALTIGTGLSGTSYDGSTAVTIANTGVLSITGTALQITASASTGAVTLSLPSSINVNTTGYAAGLAGGGANYVPYQTAVNTTGFVPPGVVGQVFTSTGSGSAPNWQNATSPPGSPGYYGAWHDTSTVTATSTTTAYVMTIGAIDLENGTSIVGGTKLTVANTAVYNLQFSAQLSNPNAQIADVSIWIRLNGVNVTDGTGTNGVPAKHGSNDGVQVVSWNYVLDLTAGDYVELVWHSDTTGVQLITFPATTSPAIPESPSLIVTIQAVTQIGIGYQGLTSATSVLIATGSQVFTTNFTNSQTAFANGTRVRVAYSSTPADFMEGVVTAFSGTTFTVLVDSIGGSGTFASWTISVAGIQGSNGVTSITGTANQVIASASTGAVTLSLPQSINSGATPTFTGTNFTGIPNAGLTNSSITINGSSVSLGGSTTVTATATNTLTIGTGLSGTSYNGSTAVTIANTGVLSFSGNSTGLTPATATTGAVSLAGVLVASNGGTGVAGSLTGLLYGNGTSAHTVATTAQALTLIGTVPVANGGTGLTTLATGYIPYGNGTGALSSSSGLTFSAGNLTVSGSFIGAGVSIGNQAPTGTSGTLLFGSGGGLNYIEAGLALTSGSAAPLLFTSIYAANEWARIDASGNLLVGTSSTGGISSNSAKIVGGVINSLNGTTASIANAASTSLATGTANTSFYQVFVNAEGNTTVFASALVYFNGAGTGTLTSIVAVGMSISSSGANIITITNLAGSSQSFSWSIIRYK
jgi:hypothetical protein